LNQGLIQRHPIQQFQPRTLSLLKAKQRINSTCSDSKRFFRA